MSEDTITVEITRARNESVINLLEGAIEQGYIKDYRIIE